MTEFWHQRGKGFSKKHTGEKYMEQNLKVIRMNEREREGKKKEEDKAVFLLSYWLHYRKHHTFLIALVNQITNYFSAL